MRRRITETIESWDQSGRRKALLIRGSRQVGKTYSVREYGNRVYGDRFLEINFKNDPGAAMLFEGGLDVDSIVMRMGARYRDFEFVPGRTLIFLDEIQECPAARTALKPLAEDGRYRVIASGSLLGIRMGEVGLHPTGYLDRVDMFPMDFEEFLWALRMPQGAIDDVRGSILRTEAIDGSLFDTFSELYSQYLVVGGMPEAVQSFVDTKTFTGVRRVHDELFDGYQDDISKYADPSVRVLARSCLESIPAMLSSENKRFMFSRVGDGTDDEEAGGVKQRGFRYYAPALEWLSMAGITLTCNRVSEPVSPLEERRDPGMFKLYMLDTGALISRYDDSVFTDVFFGDADVNSGAIAENAVAQAFAAQGRRLMYLGMSSPRTEIDFISTVGGRVCCIEVKSGSNRRCPSLDRVMRDYGVQGIMFETRNVFIDDKGVRHYPMFAASFMDSIDPRGEVVADRSGLERIRERYEGRTDQDATVRRSLPREASWDVGTMA